MSDVNRTPRLSLALLGHPTITLDREPVPALKRQKVQALLAFLAVESSRPHRREELTGLLWPEQPEAVARDNLRVTLYRLRRALSESRRRTVQCGERPLARRRRL
jgi:DNA-binding SARP family transcriptional activator